MALRNFKPNDKGFKQMAIGPEIRAALRQVAEKGQRAAETMAEEFRSDNDEPGHVHYADSFEVREETIDWRGEHPGPRAAARIHNTRPYAAELEVGEDAHRVLGRTGAALHAD